MSSKWIWQSPRRWRRAEPITKRSMPPTRPKSIPSWPTSAKIPISGAWNCPSRWTATPRCLSSPPRTWIGKCEPGKVIKNAYTYNGIVPGPIIRITEGDKIRVNVKNEMKVSTTVHWHGVLVPNKMDGVAYVTQPPDHSGQTFTYEFTAKNPGSHMYHSHHDAAEQVTKGMMAAFIIDPKDKSKDPAYDKEYIMVLNDTGIGLTINGKSFPYTQPLTAKMGQKLRIRYMNEGLMIHPMHLHGMSAAGVCQRRREPACAVPGRHAEDRARRTLRRDCGLQ